MVSMTRNDQSTQGNNSRTQEENSRSGSPAVAEVPDCSYPRFLGTLRDVVSRSYRGLSLTPKYKPLYMSRFLEEKFLVVADLEAVHEVLDNSSVFVNKDAAPSSMRELFGEESLFTMDGEEHARQRSIMRPAFSAVLRQSYISTAQDSSRRMLDYISECMRSGRKFDTHRVFEQHFISIIIQMTTGRFLRDSSLSESEFNHLASLYTDFNKGLIALPFFPNRLRAIKAREELMMEYEKKIEETLVRSKEEIDLLRDTKGIEGGSSDIKFDVLTAMCAASSLSTGSRIDAKSHRELRTMSQLLLLLWFAGFTTQTNTLMNCVLEIGLNDKLRKSLVEEQQVVMTKNGNELKVSEVLREMPLMTSFVHEVLRMYPPVPTWFKRASQDTDILGFTVKKGQRVMLDLAGTMRDEAYFEDGQKLIPERFMNNPRIEKYKTTPFGGAGNAHYCLGSQLALLNLKATMCTMLREYDLELDQNQSKKHFWIPEVLPASGVRFSRMERRAA
ncbi:hypothetical protein BWQ96_06282 [Gracilariopsis chorda]|uniref:Cytochrome P450 n=1 Tax=Gracilariopsis chorda TaxID=448386 RepID=A0A2V3IPG8_9FLOR|nr:hypothetical protein BWQ96_06282 [Gracilariopsis chorda]|eukprot:PXF43972.1 hypothetical protein BWQ96_06282 [Gracilariopsis chorda]